MTFYFFSSRACSHQDDFKTYISVTHNVPDIKIYLCVKACERMNAHLKHNWSADICLDSAAVKIILLK